MPHAMQQYSEAREDAHDGTPGAALRAFPQRGRDGSVPTLGTKKIAPERQLHSSPQCRTRALVRRPKSEQPR
jgi:hypothetical protein